MCVSQRVQHALIGVDAAEEQRLDVEVLEDAVQWRIPKAADAILVAEVQQLKSAAMPLLFQLREDQKREVRTLARLIGLEQVASQI